MLNDWQLIVLALKLWLAGDTPYRDYSIQGQTHALGWFAYPPPVLLLYSPLAFLPWQLSGLLITIVSVVGFEWWVRQQSNRIGLPWLLLWLPLCQGLQLGQLTLLNLVVLVAAEWAYTNKRDTLAGVLLALTILKPQVVILPLCWMMVVALREQRWKVPLVFGLVSAMLWGAVLAISGPALYRTWLDSLFGYSTLLPNRPLLWPPFGPCIGVLAGLLWWRHGRRDIWGTALLLNTLLYPLSVVYVAIGLAFVVIRWQPRWSWYPLLLSWLIPLLVPLPTEARTPDSIAALTQAITSTGLLAGLCPQVPLRRWLSCRSNLQEL